VAVDTVTQGQPADVAGLTFLFERESQFTGLSVARDPGAPLIWLGGLLLMIGITAVFVFPNRRLWGRLEPGPHGGSKLALAAVGRHDSGFDAEFTSIVQEIREAAVTPRQR
ncbi:MAG: cytochrome c biogenesis protein ResB, partial [Chloroflexota bacterium]